MDLAPMIEAIPETTLAEVMLASLENADEQRHDFEVIQNTPPEIPGYKRLYASEADIRIKEVVVQVGPPRNVVEVAIRVSTKARVGQGPRAIILVPDTKV